MNSSALGDSQMALGYQKGKVSRVRLKKFTNSYQEPIMINRSPYRRPFYQNYQTVLSSHKLGYSNPSALSKDEGSSGAEQPKKAEGAPNKQNHITLQEDTSTRDIDDKDIVVIQEKEDEEPLPIKENANYI